MSGQMPGMMTEWALRMRMHANSCSFWDYNGYRVESLYADYMEGGG